MTLLVPPERLANMPDLEWSPTVEISQDELLQLIPAIRSTVGHLVVAAARNYLHRVRVRINEAGTACFAINDEPWTPEVGKPSQ